MKLVHGKLADGAAKAWERGGFRGRCGLLAGAFMASQLAGIACGGIFGLAGTSAFSVASAVEEARFEAVGRELKAADSISHSLLGSLKDIKARSSEVTLKAEALSEEIDARRREKAGKGAGKRFLLEGIRKAVSPLEPVILRNVEIQRADLTRRHGPGFAAYRLIFFLHYAISDYITYRNTAGNSIPRSIADISDSASGDCKDQSALLASLALAGGLRVKYVSWSGGEMGRDGHAYLFVRIFEQASDEDINQVSEHFTKFGKNAGAFMMGRERPALRRFDDGLYIACDPTNHLVPGLIMDEYLGPEDRIRRIDFRPEDYGIAPCKR
ncbi:hypothetical protein L0Y65_05895 [Candidatus Micrarchaeota archaeon]|nr:hypothetical protein [Candidatus Micrarchaeota archaeon]